MGKKILLTGDVVVDHHIYTGERTKASMTGQRGVKTVRELGGANNAVKLINEMINQAVEHNSQEMKELQANRDRCLKARDEAKKDYEKMIKAGKPETCIAKKAKVLEIAEENLDTAAKKLQKNTSAIEEGWSVEYALEQPNLHEKPCGHHAFAVWKPCALCPEKKDTKDKVWRAAPLLGYGHETALNPCDIPEAQPFVPTPKPKGKEQDILVIDDAGTSFRTEKHKACWMLPSPQNSKPEWILLKMSSPVCRGDLYNELIKNYSKRLIVLVSAKELRLEHVNISNGLSWELTVETLRDSLHRNPLLKELAEWCKHLIIIFSGDGALWLDRTKVGKPRATLVYSPGSIEGMSTEDCEGESLGYMACIIAALTREIIAMQQRIGEKEKEQSPHFDQALKAGLGAMRDLRYNGHGIVGQPDSAAGFPAARLAKELLAGTKVFKEAFVPWSDAEIRQAGSWSILEQSQRPVDQDIRPSLIGLAKLATVMGTVALEKYPFARFGNLFTVDRKEIECLRAMRKLMREYKNGDQKKPLSIGVFGPPGAGKSFGVRQIANEIFGKESWIEFNLSQFNDVEDLTGAFHQVRDVVLGGITPVVLWDEFDSQQYKWLQYLLAPMQDGKFQEEQLTHRIGRCVFVFAGATSFSFKTFGPKPAQEGWTNFKLAKGPDFHSRLDIYYNVLGPNPRLLSEAPDSDKADPMDKCYPLRRAILLRSFLMKDPNKMLDIDNGLVSALIEIPWYRHGARSLEKIADYLKPRQKGDSVRCSALPAPTTLAMHLAAEINRALQDETDENQGVAKFYELANQDMKFKIPAVTEKLAPAIHETWRELGRKEGWLKKQNDVDYKKLSEFLKNSNKAAAQRMSDILSYVGLRLQPGAATPAERELVQKYLEHHVELLAELEHIGWKNWHEAQGWKYAAVRNDANQEHDCLKDFDELTEKDKGKDREQVLHFPDFAEKGGLKIVFAVAAK